ncbi:MAG TPA: adenylate cyclase regulatory domain-containing protein, partial [Actinomycetota bacterium]|nr:adenylate cyclase regulatory domain-containing protein [Actinomycetota bacterium]
MSLPVPYGTGLTHVTIDFEREGLLKGTRGKARRARLELLEELAADGVPLRDLRRAVEEDRLALIPVERVLEGEGRRFTAAEVAERAGVDEEVLRRNRLGLGLADPGPDEPAFTEEDVEAAKRFAALRDAGLPDQGILEVSRVIGLALAQVAAASRALVAESILAEGGTEAEIARRLAEGARELGPMMGPVLEYVLNLHLREQVRSDVIGRAEIAAGRLPGAQEVTACFADLVGFTKLGEQLPPEELGAITGRLGELASDVADPPVRLIKLIGDAAMLVSSDNDAVLDAALELVARSEAEGEGFPPLRAGLARGPALARAGDWYGRPVNLASRITAIAYPGS